GVGGAGFWGPGFLPHAMRLIAVMLPPIEVFVAKTAISVGEEEGVVGDAPAGAGVVAGDPQGAGADFDALPQHRQGGMVLALERSLHIHCALHSFINEASANS